MQGNLAGANHACETDEANKTQSRPIRGWPGSVGERAHSATPARPARHLGQTPRHPALACHSPVARRGDQAEALKGGEPYHALSRPEIRLCLMPTNDYKDKAELAKFYFLASCQVKAQPIFLNYGSLIFSLHLLSKF